tara:strand:- start:345 stop:587 length:243 start_codon:yes stop_codon:yes gene_type:complete
LKETQNSWAIPTDPYDRNKFKRAKHKNNGGPTFHVYLCPTCNRVHEDAYSNGEGRRRTSYYEGFPTYRLKRIDCVECNEE